MADKIEQSAPKSKAKKKAKNKKKKHLQPVTHTTSVIRKDNNLINKFHALTKLQESIKKDKRLSEHERTSTLEELSCKIAKLGGINAYQKASKLGESRSGGFNSAKWVIKMLKECNFRGFSGKIRLLDVGALACNYKKHTWIDCTAIDLNPQNSSVIKADFLTLPTHEQYDVVVLSLVINFEGDATRRGDMLKLCTKIVRKNGYLFIVLPLPCVKNSRFLNKELFASMMDSLGFTVTSEHCSKRLYLVMLENNENVSSKKFPRQTVRTGSKHNNFTIIL